jgi:hypothetical protein
VTNAVADAPPGLLTGGVRKGKRSSPDRRLHRGSSRTANPAGARFPKEIVGDVTTDGEVQQLAAVEAQSATAAVHRAVHDQGIWAGAADGRLGGSSQSSDCILLLRTRSSSNAVVAA